MRTAHNTIVLKMENIYRRSLKKNTAFVSTIWFREERGGQFQIAGSKQSSYNQVANSKELIIFADRKCYVTTVTS